MKKSGLKNEQFISELIISGSTAIKTKNEFGVHIFSGSVLDDGVISSKLVKPKYNQDEIIKSLDTTIVELIPVTPPELEDTVLRSIYNVALSQIDDLNGEVRRLNDEVLSLESKVTELEIVSESLRIEIDGDKILIASLQNQNQQSSDRISSTILDLQNAIQKATSEAIARVSLTARNESLLQEIDTLRIELRETRERLDKTVRDFILETSISSELERGGVRVGDIVVTPNPISDASQLPITWRGRPKNNFNNRETQWINGQFITITNPTDENIRVTITQSRFEGINRGQSDRLFSNLPTTVTVRANGKETIELRVSLNEADKFKRIVSGDTFASGDVIFTTDQSSSSIQAEIQIQRGGNFTRPS